MTLQQLLRHVTLKTTYDEFSAVLRGWLFLKRKALTVTFPGYSSSSVLWEADMILGQKITRLFQRRGLVLENYIVMDQDMRVLDLDKTLGELEIYSVVAVEKNSAKACKGANI